MRDVRCLGDRQRIQMGLIIDRPRIPGRTGARREIPFFVRGKARRNTERFAAETGLSTITVETLYDAKAHFGR